MAHHTIKAGIWRKVIGQNHAQSGLEAVSWALAEGFHTNMRYGPEPLLLGARLFTLLVLLVTVSCLPQRAVAVPPEPQASQGDKLRVLPPGRLLTVQAKGTTRKALTGKSSAQAATGMSLRQTLGNQKVTVYRD